MYFSRFAMLSSLFVMFFAWVGYKFPELFIHGRRSGFLTRIIGEPASIKLGKYLGAPLVFLFAVGLLGRGIVHEVMIWKARSGDAVAQYELAGHFYRGDFQADDFEAAIHWYKLSASRGLSASRINLGIIYLTHFRDNRVYVHEAQQLFEQAVPMNDTGGQACFNIGLMKLRGIGGPQDTVKAYSWFCLAADRNSQNGSQKRDEITKSLTPRQLKRAQKEMQTLYSKYSRRSTPDEKSHMGRIVGPVRTNTMITVTQQ